MIQAMKRSIRFGSDEEERSSPPKSNKMKHSPPVAHMGEIARFGAHLRDGDLAQVDLAR